MYESVFGSMDRTWFRGRIVGEYALCAAAARDLVAVVTSPGLLRFSLQHVCMPLSDVEHGIAWRGSVVT